MKVEDGSTIDNDIQMPLWKIFYFILHSVAAQIGRRLADKHVN